MFYSTHNHALDFSLKEAIFSGLAPDGGLFLPKEIPTLPKDFFQQLPGMSFLEVAKEIAFAFLGKELEESVIKKIVEESFPFDVPLVQLDKHLYCLETFHGPTLSFKDFGARFMARLFSHYLKKGEELHVLVATSGDTGSAVAQGFYKVPGVHVWVLYPSGKISQVQEKQITTLGENITAIEVEGVFDDCQKLVKNAFQDNELRKKLNLTSANSINIARLIPQSFYYFYAYGQLNKPTLPVAISVPSGNFGNMTGAILAKRMGLPIKYFIAATNTNATFLNFLKTGKYQPMPSQTTLSNAMDVGDPSNFARLFDLYKKDWEALKRDFYSASFTDEETVAAIAKVYQETGYIMDPHGAVGYLGLKAFPKPCEGIFLETAHPAKFQETVEKAIGTNITIPSRLKECLNKPKKSLKLKNDSASLKALLIKNPTR